MYVLPATLECRRLVVLLLLLLYSLAIVLLLFCCMLLQLCTLAERMGNGALRKQRTNILLFCFSLPPSPPPYLHCSVGIIIMIIYPRQWQTYPYLELVMEGLEKELRYGAVGSVGVDSGGDDDDDDDGILLPTNNIFSPQSIVGCCFRCVSLSLSLSLSFSYPSHLSLLCCFIYNPSPQTLYPYLVFSLLTWQFFVTLSVLCMCV